MKKLLKSVAILMLCSVYLWVGLSYAEVLVKNHRPNPEYSESNILYVFAQANAE